MSFQLQLGPGRTPWAHQQEIFTWAQDRPAAGLWMGMGTGKTGLTLNLIEYHRTMRRIDCAIIAVPLRYADTWVEEINRCFPGRKVVNCLRNPDGRLASTAERVQNACKEADYLIVNYDSLGEITHIGKKREFHFTELGTAIQSRLLKYNCAMVCDESTHIKNHRSARGKACQKLGLLAKVRYALSGTPLPQGPQDAFGQYAYLDPMIFGYKFTVFRSHFLELGGFEGKVIEGLKPHKTEEFNTKLYSIARRVTKEECMDLPPKVYQTVTYDLAPSTRKLYQQLADEWVVSMNNREYAVTTGLAKSLRLAQICTGFLGHREFDPQGEICTVEVDIPQKEKLKTLMDMLEDIPGKVIIWCKWKKNIQDIAAALGQAGILYVDYWSGTLNHHANEMAFREDPNIKVFLGTGESGGMGLNLQGPDVATEIYYSQDMKALVREQSEDRAHRGEIKHTVTIIDMVAKGTVEEAIVKGLRDKIDLQKWLLQNPAEFSKGVIKQEATGV